MPKSGNLLGKVWTEEEDEHLLKAMYEVKELKGHYAVIAKKQLATSLQRSEKATTLRWMRLLIRHQSRIEHERIKRGLLVAKQRDIQKTDPQKENKDFQSAIDFLQRAADTHDQLLTCVHELLHEVEQLRASVIWYKSQADEPKKERDDLVNAFALATKIVTEGDETVTKLRTLSIDRMGVVG
jgi:hypothetical protein